jgi:hypothetical protein
MAIVAVHYRFQEKIVYGACYFSFCVEQELRVLNQEIGEFLLQ